jgi:uncharacterized protein YjbI with pentapeptide repeats
MDVGELLARYAAGERQFIGVDLNYAYLVNANLSRANLSNANLAKAYLMDANLSNANLSNANLVEAYLMDANLSNANLSNATLGAVDLSGASLIGAKIGGANLREANLIYANLGGADLSGANLSNAYLSDANLINANLANADLSGARLDGTILAYQEVSEELQREKQELIKQVQLLQAQLEQQKLNKDLRQISNQGIKAPCQWNGFYFRSQPEIKIAEAFDRVGILFYPNCRARLSSAVGREGKETDFLVFYQGKCGILEVDGEPWHPPSRAVHDHERDRLFKVHGIRVVEHYDATRCSRQPDEVVQEFLEILRQA